MSYSRLKALVPYLPLENKISNPKLFQPILWTGMFIVITLYVILGVIGYLDIWL